MGLVSSNLTLSAKWVRGEYGLSRRIVNPVGCSPLKVRILPGPQKDDDERCAVKVCICGSRSIGSFEIISQAVSASGFAPTLIIQGGCRGVDLFAKEWAIMKNIPCAEIIAYWQSFGKAAGPIRNKAMLGLADAVIAIWDGKSKGTGGMIEMTRKAGKPLFVYSL